MYARDTTGRQSTSRLRKSKRSLQNNVVAGSHVPVDPLAEGVEVVGTSALRDVP
jgi:hypothetical protein